MDPAEEHLQGSELAFFGAVTASATHELNNVLAVIEQTTGLLEDLSANPAAASNPLLPKIRQIVERLQRQVVRGTGVTRQLNVFAHSADKPVQTVELRGLLENLLGLMQRHAALKKVRLELDSPLPPLFFTTRPFALEQAIFTGIQMALEGSSPEGVIKISFCKISEAAVVSIAWVLAASVENPRTSPPALEMLVRTLGGQVQIISEGRDLRLELKLPQISGEAL